MTIDEAIQHCREKVQEQAKKGCYSCAEEHQQLAEWLKELKAYREEAQGMKLLIDIPEHIYEHAKEGSEDSRDEGEAMRAIANGTQQKSCSEIPNTCVDAISRKDTCNAIIKRLGIKDETFLLEAERAIYQQILAMPSVTPQQRTGQWVKEGQGGRYKWMCSNCGTHHRALDDYCPSCGAKMEVEE